MIRQDQARNDEIFECKVIEMEMLVVLKE